MLEVTECAKVEVHQYSHDLTVCYPVGTIVAFLFQGSCYLMFFYLLIKIFAGIVCNTECFRNFVWGKYALSIFIMLLIFSYKYN